MVYRYCMYISYLFMVIFYSLKIYILIISHIFITIGTIAYLFAVTTRHLMCIRPVLNLYQLLVGITFIVSITALKLQVFNLEWVIKLILHRHFWKLFICHNDHIVMKSFIYKLLTNLYLSDFLKLIFTTRRG